MLLIIPIKFQHMYTHVPHVMQHNLFMPDLSYKMQGMSAQASPSYSNPATWIMDT